MTKSQKIIVMAAAVLIAIKILFVPYRTIERTLETTSAMDSRIMVQKKTVDAGWKLIIGLRRNMCQPGLRVDIFPPRLYHSCQEGK